MHGMWVFSVCGNIRLAGKGQMPELHQNWVNHSGYLAKSERMLSAAYFASRIHRGGNLR